MSITPEPPTARHSDEAIAAYPDAPFTEVFGRHRSIIDQRTAFDRGRESKQRTDRETIAALIGAQERWTSTSSYVTTTDALIAADAILAAPSLSLVAVRDEVARVLHEQFNAARGRNGVDPMALADALFASGILKPSSGGGADQNVRVVFYVREDEMVYDHEDSLVVGKVASQGAAGSLEGGRATGRLHDQGAPRRWVCGLEH